MRTSRRSLVSRVFLRHKRDEYCVSHANLENIPTGLLIPNRCIVDKLEVIYCGCYWGFSFLSVRCWWLTWHAFCDSGARSPRQVLLTVTHKIICEVIPKFYFGVIHPHAPRTSHVQQCTSETWKWSEIFLWINEIQVTRTTFWDGNCAKNFIDSCGNCVFVRWQGRNEAERECTVYFMCYIITQK